MDSCVGRLVLIEFSTLEELLVRDSVKPFFEKGYGLELLLRLHLTNEEQGIEETYKKIVSPKPGYASFHKFIHRLAAIGALELHVVEDKKSQRRLVLPETTKLVLESILFK